jgi:hypothetical protein
MELPVCEYRREGTYSPLPSAYLPRVGWTPSVENGLSERGVDTPAIGVTASTRRTQARAAARCQYVRTNTCSHYVTKL